ncbi:MAG: diaminopimelate decarboxylase [Candidatus Aminicenantes bacterium]|nr:diaminopimelate decarboxylase [Candidatus Aminicenantes bacterium]
MIWWENEFVRAAGNRLILGRFRAEDLARKHGTPLFVYGAARIRVNGRRLARAFAAATSLETRLAYAMKANAHPAVLALIREEGGWIDAVSPGEVARALEAGFSPGRIIFTGTSISAGDFEQLLRVDGLTINLDAVEQLDILRDVRDRLRLRRPIRISFRWNPGRGCGFNPKVITAGSRSVDGTPIKFGVEERRVLGAFRKARECGFLPIGLHQHLGSGWVKADFPAVLESVDRMIGKAGELAAAGFDLEFLDFGGGFGPRYHRADGLFPVEAYVRAIGRMVRKAGLSLKALVVEPGKYWLADAGVLLLRVEYVKTSYGHLFACVNGGTFNTIPRPAVYGQARHAIVNAGRIAERPRRRVTVAGHLCETGDIFGKDLLLPVPRPGDILAVLQAGAYGRSMASTYNLRPIPAELLV